MKELISDTTGNEFLPWIILILALSLAAIVFMSKILRRVTKRRRATAEALQKTHEQLADQNLKMKTILEALPVGVEVYSRYGFLEDINQHACRIFGVTHENALNNSVPILQNPIIPDEIKRAFLEDEKIQMDFFYDFSKVHSTGFYITDKDATERMRVSFSGTPILGNDGVLQNYVFIMDDITEKYEQKQQLQESIRLSNQAMQASNLVLWKYDNRIGSFSSNNDPLNDFDSNMTLPAEEYFSAMHPEDMPRIWETMKMMNEGSDQSYEIPIRVKTKYDAEWQYCVVSGTPFIKDESGKVVVYTGIRRNNSAWKSLNDALLKANQQNELILNNSNSGLVYIDRNYMVQWANLTVCSASISHSIYKKGELCYISYGRTSPCENCIMQKAIQSHHAERHVLNINERMIESCATPIFNSEDKVEGVVLRLDDVSERERWITELSSAKEAAERSDKLKSMFLANMSHEIRTPLNAIVGFSSLLMNADNEEEKAEYARIINTNNELLLCLISDILDLSKIEAGFIEQNAEEFDLAGHFNELYYSVQQRMKNPAVKLICDNPYQQCMVHLDKNRVAQVVMNYATNAVKHTYEGTITMGYQCCDGGIRLYVSDTGTGIAEKDLERVYQRFEKLNEFVQGTGLGLSICKAVTESLGGKLGVTSELGVGSTFWSWIPCKVHTQKATEEDRSHTGTDKERLPEKKTERKKILVAEDIESNYSLVSAMLTGDYELVRANDGIEAVEQAQSAEFDLVFMDIRMPRMDGLEAAKQIRAMNPGIPIVALTAHAFDSDKKTALAVGCTAYLVKPVTSDILKQVVNEFLNTPL